MTPTSDPRQLAAEAATLNEELHRLTERLNLSQQQVRRMRWLTVLTAALAVLAIVGGVVSIQLWHNVHEAAHATQLAQVQNCRNNNEAREANLKLWGFILDASEQAPGRTAQQRAQIKRLRAWVALLYAPRDCKDLTKTYPIPDPPVLKPRKG